LQSPLSQPSCFYTFISLSKQEWSFTDIKPNQILFFYPKYWNDFCVAHSNNQRPVKAFKDLHDLAHINFSDIIPSSLFRLSYQAFIKASWIYLYYTLEYFSLPVEFFPWIAKWLNSPNSFRTVQMLPFQWVFTLTTLLPAPQCFCLPIL
jgi:hypothetical protein